MYVELSEGHKLVKAGDLSSGNIIQMPDHQVHVVEIDEENDGMLLVGTVPPSWSAGWNPSNRYRMHKEQTVEIAET